MNMLSQGDAFDDFNIPLSIIKTSLFGETNLAENYARITPFAWAALILGTILVILAAFATVYVTVKKLRKKEDTVESIYWFLSWIVPVVFLVHFSFKAPYFSSQDFRYIQYVIVIEGMFLGLFSKEGKKREQFIACLLALFCLSTSAVYILLGKP
ncbi:MAG: hypothetical protein IJS86_03400 [Lachnospiraceae bacterium]|nr:hypothetical protein [Lachnospiraceae bacterium]